MSNQLYRHYGFDGCLLYVGISFSAVARLAQHRKVAEWFDQIAWIEVEHFETREESRQAEKKAILNEFPRFNKQGRSQFDRHPQVKFDKPYCEPRLRL